MNRLPDRLQFEQRAIDANGDRLGAFEVMFACQARITYRRGTEVAEMHRLESRQPVLIDIRDTAETRDIDAGWRAVIQEGKRKGETFNITAAAPGQRRGYLNLTGLSGVASG